MITYCIPTKNNLRYLKNSIKSIKKYTSLQSEIIVYVDSDNDGTEKWLIENKILYIKNNDIKPKGIAYGYNRCIELSNKDIICMFHADMYMGESFEENILKHLKEKTIVAATRIEPPLHPEGKEKIVKNFGMYPEDFNEKEFNDFVKKCLVEYSNKTTKGIFAPWACYKKDIIEIELHDEYFHSYHEDSDIFQRFILNGYNIIQSRDALVYHLTCRGGQFQDGVEKVTQDAEFHKMKTRSAGHFIRKWGSWIENNEYCYPIISKKYDIGFIVKNCNSQLLCALEPWCSTIYTSLNTEHFIEKIQSDTIFDINKRIKKESDEKTNRVLISFDANKLNQENFSVISNLSKILSDSGEIGTFEYDIFSIEIKNLASFENKLVKLNNSYYIDQLIHILGSKEAPIPLG